MARLTLQEAADQLRVSTRTLRRRIKARLIHADLEDGKYYFSVTEVDRLAGTVVGLDKGAVVKTAGLSSPSTMIVLEKTEYDSLIGRLGFLEGQQRLLLEDKEATTAQAQELAAARVEVEKLRVQLAGKKDRPAWWKRFLRQEEKIS